MSINVRHLGPIALDAAIMQQVGTNQGIAQAGPAEEARARFLLSLGNQKQQQDRAYGLEVAQLALGNDRFYAGLNSNLARADAQTQAQMLDRQQARDYSLLGRQLGYEQGLNRELLDQEGQAAEDARQLERDRLQAGYDMQQQHGLWGQQQVVSLDKQVDAELGRIRKLNLTPEGKRIFHELAGKRRSIQADPTLRPDARQQALGFLAKDLEEAGLDHYEEKIPTIEEQITTDTWVDEYGTRLGKDRYGTVRKLSAPPKSEKPAKIPGVIEPADYQKEYQAAFQRLLQTRSLQSDEAKRSAPITNDEVQDELRRYAQSQISFYGQQSAQQFGGMQLPMGMQGSSTLAPQLDSGANPLDMSGVGGASVSTPYSGLPTGEPQINSGGGVDEPAPIEIPTDAPPEVVRKIIGGLEPGVIISRGGRRARLLPNGEVELLP